MPNQSSENVHPPTSTKSTDRDVVPRPTTMGVGDAGLRSPGGLNSDGELLAWESLLSNSAADKVDKKILRRENRFRATIGVFIVAATGIGFFNISAIEASVTSNTSAKTREAIAEVELKLRRDIRDSVQETLLLEMREELKNVLTEELSAVETRVAVQVAFFDLFNLAKELSANGREGFTNTERDAAVSLIDVVMSDEEMANRPELAAVLSNVVDTFISAGLVEFVDNVESRIHQVAVQDQGLTLALGVHYATVWLGKPDRTEDDRLRFARYLDALVLHKSPELMILFRALDGFVESGMERNPLSTGLLEDLRSLNELDRATFTSVLNDILERRQESQANEGGLLIAYHLRVGDRLQLFATEYREELDAVN